MSVRNENGSPGFKGGREMHCLKCGKEIKDKQVFCAHCLSLMENYPVKPDTPVQLPIRTPNVATPKSRLKRRSFNPEEQLLRLRKTVRVLVAMVLFLTLILCFTCAVLTHTLLNQETPNVGKNYTYDLSLE